MAGSMTKSALNLARLGLKVARASLPAYVLQVFTPALAADHQAGSSPTGDPSPLPMSHAKATCE